MQKESISFILQNGSRAFARIRRSSRAKRLRLTVSPNGILTLTAPERIPFADIEKMSRNFTDWLEKTLKKTKTVSSGRIFPEHVHIPLLGCDFKTEICHACQPEPGVGAIPAKVSGIMFFIEDRRLRFFGKTREERSYIEALQTCMRYMANLTLPPYIGELAERSSFGKVKVTIRNQRSRWGSCSRSLAAKPASEPVKGNISINWRALLLPEPLLEHLCWHELTHLKQMNHSPAFYAQLGKYSPNWQKNEKELTKAWRELPGWALPE